MNTYDENTKYPFLDKTYSPTKNSSIIQTIPAERAAFESIGEKSVLIVVEKAAKDRSSIVDTSRMLRINSCLLLSSP